MKATELMIKLKATEFTLIMMELGMKACGSMTNSMEGAKKNGQMGQITKESI